MKYRKFIRALCCDMGFYTEGSGLWVKIISPRQYPGVCVDYSRSGEQMRMIGAPPSRKSGQTAEAIVCWLTVNPLGRTLVEWGKPV